MKHPHTKEQIADSFRTLGQYIIDKADDYAGELRKTKEVDLRLTIRFDEIPTIEVVKRDYIPIVFVDIEPE